MQTDRCPNCAGFVPPGADWCGQCFTSLTRAPEPVDFDPLTAPLTAVEARLAVTAYAAPAPPAYAEPAAPMLPAYAEPAAPARAQVAPAASVAPAPAPAPTPAPDRPGEAPSWPCTRCGELNDVAADACARCGSAFLAGVEQSDLTVPGLGRATTLDKPQKVAVVVGGTLVVTLFLLGLSILLGAVL